MKICYGLLLSIFFFSAQAQRQVKVSKEELISQIKEDIGFWKYRMSSYLSKSPQSSIQLTKKTGNEWSQSSIEAKDFSNLICTKYKIAIYDSLANKIGENEQTNYPPCSFIAISQEPGLKNKIGFGFKKYDILGNYVDDYIFFVNSDSWPNIKEQRKTDFLTMLPIMIQTQKSDTIMHISLNDRNSQLYLLDIESYESESNASKILGNTLFRLYDNDFASIYYSGKDSSYDRDTDEWGNVYMTPRNINEYWVSVYGEHENVTKKRMLPTTVNLQAIGLFFEKLSSCDKPRMIYPGATFPIYLSSGDKLGDVTYSLNPQSLKRFHPISQSLFSYLTQIYH